MNALRNESVFTWAAPPLKFGDGALDEVADEVARLGAESCLVLTDPGVRNTGIPDRVAAQLRAAGIKSEIFDGVGVEPTDESIEQAVSPPASSRGTPIRYRRRFGDRHREGREPADQPPRRAAGLRDAADRCRQSAVAPAQAADRDPHDRRHGVESTTICVVDMLQLHLKAGISHPSLRPVLAIVDPTATAQPARRR